MTLAPASGHGVWDRVVCAVDLTPASVAAARQAAWLMPAAAKLTLCAVASREAMEGGVLLDSSLMDEARAGLERTQGQVAAFHESELHLREGSAIHRLLDELRAEQATMVAVGSHRHSRAAGIALGSVARAMLHEAACSVLVAHADDEPASDACGPGFGDVVVGFDGSGGARRALGVGRELAARLSLNLRVLVATGDGHPPGPGWSRDQLGEDIAVSEDPRASVDALTHASGSAGLLVLGSRHLRGIPALGSVSERVAPRASCPVLVVR